MRNVQTHHDARKTLLWLSCAATWPSGGHYPEWWRYASLEVGAKQDFARLVGQSFHLIHIDAHQSIADFHHGIPR